MIDACFTPTTLFAEAGETVRFVNLDGSPHNMTADVRVLCTYHPGMSGAIVVGGDGFGSDIAPALVTAPSALAAADGGRLAAGAFGQLVGAAAGVGLASVRRRTAVPDDGPRR